jgi:phage-related minor tail protein
MANEIGDSGSEAPLNAAEVAQTIGDLERRIEDLRSSANGFANAMTQAFTQSVVGGKQFDDVLKSLALRISSIAVTAAFKPLASGLADGLANLLGGLFGGAASGGKLAAAMGAIKPFAAGGLIATPN